MCNIWRFYETMPAVPSLFEVVLLVRFEDELYVVHPIITENGTMALPLSGWERIDDDDNDGAPDVCTL